jgi:hypothetical protein
MPVQAQIADASKPNPNQNQTQNRKKANHTPSSEKPKL